jgi:hypothetical protein
MFTPVFRSGRSGCLCAIFVTGVSAGTVAVSADAAPLVLEETTRISTPDPEYVWPISLAVDGDWLLASGIKYDWDTYISDSSTWLYHRESSGTWTLVGKLVQSFSPEEEPKPGPRVAMRGGVAAIIKESGSWIFERSGNTWSAVPSPMQTDGSDVAIDGGTIVVTSGYCDRQTNAYRKASNGAWTLVRNTPPEPDNLCEDNDPTPGSGNSGGDIDVSGNAVIVATFAPPGSARIFEGPYGAPPTMTQLFAPQEPPGFGSVVAIDRNFALVRHHPLTGIEAFTRNAGGQWLHSGSLQRPDALDILAPDRIRMSGALAIASQMRDSTYQESLGSASVFERNTDGTYRYAAKLIPSNKPGLGGFFTASDIDDRRVVAGCADTANAYVFDLPATLTNATTMQDDFQDGNASDWTPVAGGSFTVATTGASRVYRQSNTVSKATSLWNNTDRKNQTIEADIKPTQYASTAGDKWFGLAARYTDANNHYYATLRNDNTVLLRKMVNGAFTTLGSASLPIALNRSYRVRLEAIGTHIRLFVDNALLAEASDSALTHGQAGVMMYKTQADYDNVLVSSNPRTLLFRHSFGDFAQNDSTAYWETLGTWTQFDSMFIQSDVASGARAITGIATADQVVQARMRSTSSAGTNNWFGLAARYSGEGNYYYVTLRNNNTVSLRKQVNGVITELDSAALTITPNTWYKVRMEAVGTQLRVYIDNVLRLDATDASHATGRYGPMMYRTAAQYDDILAVEP